MRPLSVSLAALALFVLAVPVARANWYHTHHRAGFAPAYTSAYVPVHVGTAAYAPAYTSAYTAAAYAPAYAPAHAGMAAYTPAYTHAYSAAAYAPAYSAAAYAPAYVPAQAGMAAYTPAYSAAVYAPAYVGPATSASTVSAAGILDFVTVIERVLTITDRFRNEGSTPGRPGTTTGINRRLTRIENRLADLERRVARLDRKPAPRDEEGEDLGEDPDDDRPQHLGGASVAPSMTSGAGDTTSPLRRPTQAAARARANLNMAEDAYEKVIQGYDRYTQRLTPTELGFFRADLTHLYELLTSSGRKVSPVPPAR